VPREIGRRLTADDALELGGELRVGLAIAGHGGFPLRALERAPCAQRVERRDRVVGHDERGLDRPANRVLHELDLGRAERRAVRRRRVLLVGRAMPDVRPAADDRWLERLGARRVDGTPDGQAVVSVDDLGVPAVGLEALRDVLRPRELGLAFDGDGVVVVQEAELAEAQVARQRRGFGGDAFVQVTVAEQMPKVM
jgi:hypothetical protein